MSYTLYDVLEIPASSTSEEIKAAYKKLAKKYHPDKNAGNIWSEDQFKKINQAYQILSNPSKRSLYDNRLEYEAFRKQNPTPTQTRPTTRRRTEHKRPAPIRKEPPPLIDVSNNRMNLLVLSYYVIAIFTLQYIYFYLDNRETKDLFELAYEYEKMGQYDNAIVTYTKAVVLDEEDPEAYEKRGMARLKASTDIEGALYDFSTAIEYSDEPSDSLLYKRAKCYYQLNNYPLAMVDLKTITSHEENTIDSAYFYKAEINFSFQKYDLAIPDYSQFLLFKPSSIDAHWKRGICYFVRDDFENALPDYNYIITRQPDNAEHYYYRGIINFALKDTSGGCVDFNDAVLLGYTGAEETIKMYCK
jgi:curved DNA-binding protein CbpA